MSNLLARTKTVPWLPYVVPLAFFLVMTAVEGQVRSLYPWLYCVKIVLVSVLLLALRPRLADVRLRASGQVLAVFAGCLLVVAWVAIDHVTPHFSFLGGRVGYNPFQEIVNPTGRAAFIAVRFFGLVIIVPIIEETFYRDFLLRYVSDPDHWDSLPLGRFTSMALAANMVIFSLSHPEWLAAAVFALAMCLLLARTQNLSACITAHGVTNLLLGLYVIHWHQWQYW